MKTIRISLIIISTIGYIFYSNIYAQDKQQSATLGGPYSSFIEKWGEPTEENITDGEYFLYWYKIKGIDVRVYFTEKHGRCYLIRLNSDSSKLSEKNWPIWEKRFAPKIQWDTENIKKESVSNMRTFSSYSTIEKHSKNKRILSRYDRTNSRVMIEFIDTFVRNKIRSSKSNPNIENF